MQIITDQRNESLSLGNTSREGLVCGDSGQGRRGGVAVQYETNKAILRVTRTLDTETIFALCDEARIAVLDYYYREIELELDSPGGSLEAMTHFFAQLALLRKRARFRFSTMAMTHADSAAAIILAMGDAGSRRAYASTTMLFHEPRIMTTDTEIWTQGRLAGSHQRLAHAGNDVLEQIADQLFQHVVKPRSIMELPIVSAGRTGASVPGNALPIAEIRAGRHQRHVSRKQIVRSLRSLLAAEVPVSAAVAQRFLLIDEIVC